MRRLAAERADGVLLNWLTPRGGGERDGGPATRCGGRPCAASSRAYDRRRGCRGARRGSARYGAFPTYAANFERLGIEAIDTTIRTPDDLAAFRPIGRRGRAAGDHADGSLAELERLVDTYAAAIAG